MLDAEILKAAPQFELPSGLPEVLGELRRLIGDPDVSVTLSPVLMEAAKLLNRIPAMVEEIARLREERDQFAEQAAARDQRDTDMQEIMGVNNSLRALNADLIKAVQDMLYWADTPSQDVSPSWITGACYRARAILRICESKSATTQPRIPGLPAQAPTATSSQPAPGGIIETEKGNE